MPLNNLSLSSLGSIKDKDLPPIPSPAASPESRMFPKMTETKDNGEILEAKSLRRKNFKKLSLESSPAKKMEEKSSIRLEIPRLSKNKVRPAPLLNLNRESFSKNNQDAVLSKGNQDLLDQFSKLELSNLKNNENSKIFGANRKRQTVISSISPTKSKSNSPAEVLNHSVDLTLSDQSSPISTTSSIKLNNNDLLTLKNLGSGNSGTVSKILHIPSQKTMAKKVIHIESKSVIQTHIIRELKILHECRSPYIIEFYGAFINNNNTIVICMEYCNCGSLDKILTLCSPKIFPLFVLKKVVYSILSGLDYLYKTHKIIHRDIKPSNVLMTHKGEFKLCDFGVSRELTNSLAMADTFVGTSTYMSPERIQGLHYGVKSDIWSMGLMLIELSSGLSIWADDTESAAQPEGILDLLQRIVNETPPTLTKKINPISHTNYDPLLCEFIDLCLVKEEKERKSPSELLGLKTPFLYGVEQGAYDKDVKKWAKEIRKLHKERHGES